MTSDEVLAMAREVGIEVHERKQEARIGMDVLVGADSTDKLMRFAALVAAKERAACAQVVQAWNTAMTDKLAKEIRATANVDLGVSPVEKEREACAQICDHYAFALDHSGSSYLRSRECQQAAVAIRARGQEASDAS